MKHYLALIFLGLFFLSTQAQITNRDFRDALSQDRQVAATVISFEKSKALIETDGSSRTLTHELKVQISKALPIDLNFKIQPVEGAVISKRIRNAFTQTSVLKAKSKEQVVRFKINEKELSDSKFEKLVLELLLPSSANLRKHKITFKNVEQVITIKRIAPQVLQKPKITFKFNSKESVITNDGTPGNLTHDILVSTSEGLPADIKFYVEPGKEFSNYSISKSFYNASVFYKSKTSRKVTLTINKEELKKSGLEKIALRLAMPSEYLKRYNIDLSQEWHAVTIRNSNPPDTSPEKIWVNVNPNRSALTNDGSEGNLIHKLRLVASKKLPINFNFRIEASGQNVNNEVERIFGSNQVFRKDQREQTFEFKLDKKTLKKAGIDQINLSLIGFRNNNDKYDIKFNNARQVVRIQNNFNNAATDPPVNNSTENQDEIVVQGVTESVPEEGAFTEESEPEAPDKFEAGEIDEESQEEPGKDLREDSVSDEQKSKMNILWYIVLGILTFFAFYIESKRRGKLVPMSGQGDEEFEDDVDFEVDDDMGEGGSEASGDMGAEESSGTPRGMEMGEEMAEEAGEEEMEAVGAVLPAKFTIVPTFYGTDREPTRKSAPDKMFGSERGELSFGICEVSIPKTHKMGEIESPLWGLKIFENENKHIILKKVEALKEENFIELFKEKLSQTGKKSALIFVHGFNVSFSEAAKRTAQIAYDLRFDGVPAFYSWPSHAKTLSYIPDESNIEWTQPNMEAFLEKILTDTEAENIYIIAHSMGTRALSKSVASIVENKPTLRKKIQEIILTAPDIDADVFKRDIAPKIVNAGNRLTLYASSEDIALKASKKIHQNSRAGESGEDIVLVDGMSSIDATGHGYRFSKAFLLWR